MSFQSPILDAIRTRLRFPKNHRSATISDDEEEDHIVWDEPDPFGPPDPTLARLRALIDAEIARTRQRESIGPLDAVDDSDSDGGYDYDSDEDQVSDGESDWDDDTHDYDGDADCEDNDEDDTVEFVPIRLPRLLNISLRLIPSPSPPPSNMDWASLAQAYNDTADDHERAFRREKRDAYRSRSKALAILGPEASVAL